MSTVHARVISPDHDIAEELVYESGDLAPLQEAVGGWVEGLEIPEGFLYANEEGLLRSLPTNPAASLLAGRPIVGTVVVTGPIRRGSSTSIPDALAHRLRTVGLTLA